MREIGEASIQIVPRTLLTQIDNLSVIVRTVESDDLLLAYTPEQALWQAQRLIEAALRLNPSLREPFRDALVGSVDGKPVLRAIAGGDA